MFLYTCHAEWQNVSNRNYEYTYILSSILQMKSTFFKKLKAVYIQEMLDTKQFKIFFPVSCLKILLSVRKYQKK